MKRIVWVFPFLLLTVLAGCHQRVAGSVQPKRALAAPVQVAPVQVAPVQVAPVQAQRIVWVNSKAYEDFRLIFDEKDDIKKAARAEQFLVDHSNADPTALTNVYSMMFLAYASAGNWAKVLETFDRISLAPKLTDDVKRYFAETASTARQRLGK
jgi:hypothetical protein